MTTQPSSEGGMNPRHPQKSYTGIAVAIGIVAVAAIGFLTYSNSQKAREVEEVTFEMNEAATLRAELENQYNEAVAELESLKGSNSEMNALIEQQKTELEAQKGRISVLLADSKNLKQARQEMANLRTQVTQYVAEIEQLKTQNQELTTANTGLTRDRDSLHTNLQSRIQENTQLNEAQAVLVSEKEVLAKSVEIGSVIHVRDVRVEGLKVRSNGKVDDKKSAKKVDQLKICFTTLTNEVVQPGVEQFHVRVVNPKGETLAVESLGSGAITNKKSGDEVRFTQFAETEYRNDEQQLCMLWMPDVGFHSGKYQVEVYNKGYLAGTGSFELK